MPRYTRQRICVLSLVEQTTAGTGPITGIPGASSHGGQVVSRRLVMDAPFDTIFKDTQKAVPHARFDGQNKVWYVELLNSPDSVVINVLNHLTGPVFLVGARDRQYSIEVTHELATFAQPYMSVGTQPTLFTWTDPCVVRTSTSIIVPCTDIPALLAAMSIHVGPAPVFVPTPSNYRPTPAANHAAVAAQTHRPTAAAVAAAHAAVTVRPGVSPPVETFNESAMTEADEVALSGSYGDMDAPADEALAGACDIKVSPGMPKQIMNPKTLEMRTLYPHQRMALERIRMQIAGMDDADPVRLILAHDPGLGKTTTAVSFAAFHPMGSFPDHAVHEQPIKRIVVVCPERARTMWAETFTAWTGRECFRYGVEGQAGRDWSMTENGVLIIGYSSVIKESFVEKLGHQPFEGSLLIVDEAHYLSNHKSKRSIAVRKIAHRFLYTLMLTGTPMLAHPIELYPLLDLAHDGKFQTYWRFATRFANAHKTKFGWDVKGSSNLPELTNLLAANMHRVRKSQADLPPKRRVLVPIDIETEDRREMENDVAQAMSGLTMPVPTGIPGAAVHGPAGGVTNIAVSGSIRQIVYDARRDETLEWIVDWAKAQPDRKLVVFAWNKAAVHDLAQGLIGALDLPFGAVAAIDGDTKIAERDSTVKLFNQPTSKLRFLVATIASAGTVYDMHGACCDGVFAQCDWTPGTMIQAEDRLGRSPGGESVTWYYLCAAGTVDERIVKTLHKKQETFTQVVDGGEALADYGDVLGEILAWKAARDQDGRYAKRKPAAQQETVA
jgi:SWI/SNF-related matrix-associated actin-dependent regulator 1 of chromatin subfamily A